MDFIDGNVGQVVSISVVDSENIYQYHLETLSNGDTPNNQTIYEIGSLTKTYTGLVVAKAILDGKVELDKDIRHYLKSNEYKNLELSSQYITLRLFYRLIFLLKTFQYYSVRFILPLELIFADLSMILSTHTYFSSPKI